MATGEGAEAAAVSMRESLKRVYVTMCGDIIYI